MLRNDMRLDDLIARAKTLGETEGKGANSMAELAIQVTQGAHEGYIDTGKGSNDVESIYNAFVQGKSSKATDKAPNAGSQAAQISKLNAFARLGRHPGIDPTRVVTAARDIINNHEDTKGSTYSNLVKVAREQLKVEYELNEEEIRLAILPPQKDEKTELSQWEKLLASATKTRDGKKPSDSDPVGEPGFPSPELDRVIEVMSAKVAELEAAKAEREAEQAKGKAAALKTTNTTIVTPAPAPVPASITPEVTLGDALDALHEPASEPAPVRTTAPAPEHPGLVITSLETGKTTTIQPIGTVAPAIATVDLDYEPSEDVSAAMDDYLDNLLGQHLEAAE